MKKLTLLFLLTINCHAIYSQGGVGIGTSTPNAPLQFSNDIENRKIVLHEVANNDHDFFGFGISPYTLRYQVPNPYSDHVFYTGDTGVPDSLSYEVMRIKGYGYVGIRNNPTNMLDVGTFRSGSHPSHRGLYVTKPTESYTDPIVEFRHASGSQGIGFSYNTMLASGSNTDQNLTLAAKGDGSLIFRLDSTERMRITSTGVGIGVTSPNASLQFANDIQSRKVVLYEIENNDNEFYGFGLDPGSIRYQVGNTGSDHIFYAGLSWDNSVDLLRIKGNGNIGIGNDPTNRLDVGKFRNGVHANNRGLYVTHSTNSQAEPIAEFRHTDGLQGIGFGYNTILASGSATDQDLNLAAKGANGNLTLFTNGTERLRMNGSGNLGLGVANPQNTLDIHRGTARTNAHPGGSALYVTGNGEFRSADATVGMRILSNVLTSWGNNSDIDLTLATKGAGSIIFSTPNNTERMRITSTGVGIGVNSPNAQLHLSQVAQNKKIVLWESAVNDHEFYGFGINSNTLRYQTDHPASDHVFYAAINTTSSRELMRVKGNGNVGIGITAPHAPLQFSSTAANRKIVLNEVANNEHEFMGFGQNTTSMRYQVSATSADHIFYAAANSSASNELMRIEGTGDVGIGISNPGNKMDIASAARSNTHPTGKPLYVTGNFSFNSNGVEFRHSDATQGIGFGTNTIYAAGSNAVQNLGLEAKGTGSLLFRTNGALSMMIDGTNGNVGIGTIAPHAPLQFGQALENRKIVLWELNDNNHEFFGFGINAGIMRYQVPNAVNDHVFYAGTSGSASNEVMRIKGNGNVGIGNATPNAPLQLSNAIQNRKIVLAEVVNNNHQFAGFGINGDQGLRYQTPGENTEHTFYTSAGNASLELMRVGNIDGLVVTVATSMQNATINQNLTVQGSVTLNGGIVNEAFITPTLLNGFAHYQNGFANAGYYKDKTGRVCLRGLVNITGNPTGLVIFTLPPGYRPTTSGRLLFPVLNNDATARVDILTNGDVIVSTGSSGWVSLDGITFRAD